MPPTPARSLAARAGVAVLAALAVLAAIGAPAGAAGARAGSRNSSTSADHKPAKHKKATFGIGPATDGELDQRPVLNFDAEPGSAIHDEVAVVNLANAPVTLNLYTADGLNGADGSIGFAPKADPGKDARGWIQLHTPGGPPTIHLAARQTRIVRFDLQIPTDATPGDHFVGIVASLTSKVRNSKGADVNFEQRVALHTLIRVSGPLNPRLTVDNLHVTYHGSANPFGSGSATVTYTVRNTGNIDLGGQQAVKISGLFGSTGSPHALANVPVLLPRSSYPVRVDVPGVWPEIFLHAKVTVTPLSVAGAADPQLPQATAETSFVAIPWALLVLLIALGGAGYGAWRWRRKRRSYAARHPKKPQREPALSGKA
jgi:hypothetical protein